MRMSVRATVRNLDGIVSEIQESLQFIKAQEKFARIKDLSQSYHHMLLCLIDEQRRARLTIIEKNYMLVHVQRIEEAYDHINAHISDSIYHYPYKTNALVDEIKLLRQLGVIQATLIRHFAV